MSFAEGFFTTSANAITARKMEIRDRRAKDRDYLMTYGTQAITKAREGADSVANIAGILQAEYNFSPENIAFLVDKTGVAGITSLYEKVKDFTPQQAKASNFNGLFMGVEDYVYDSEKDLKQQIEKAFGLYKSNVTTDPQENERVGFLARLGLDIFNDSGEEFKTVGGYSIEDARRIAATPASSMSNPLGNIFDTTKLPRKLSSFELGATTKYVEGAIEGIATAYINDGKVTAREASKINNLITEKNWAELSAMPVLKEKLNSRFFNYEEEYGILGSNPGLSYLKKNGLLEEIEEIDPLEQLQITLDTINKKKTKDGKPLNIAGEFPTSISDVSTFENKEALDASEDAIGIINGALFISSPKKETTLEVELSASDQNVEEIFQGLVLEKINKIGQENYDYSKAYIDKFLRRQAEAMAEDTFNKKKTIEQMVEEFIEKKRKSNMSLSEEALENLRINKRKELLRQFPEKAVKT